MLTSDITGPRDTKPSTSRNLMVKCPKVVSSPTLKHKVSITLGGVNKYLYQEILSLVTGLFVY